MPFQGHAFRALTPEEASPFGNIIQNMMRDYQNAVKSAYLKPSLAEELKKAQLASKKSALALSQAQMANKYLPGKLEAEAKAREFKLKHPYAYLPGEAGQLGALMAMAEDPALSQYFGGTGQAQNAPKMQPGMQPQMQPEDNAGDFTSRLSQLLGSGEPKNYVEMLPKAQPAMQPAMQPEIQKPTNPFQKLLQTKINKMMGGSDKHSQYYTALSDYEEAKNAYGENDPRTKDLKEVADAMKRNVVQGKSPSKETLEHWKQTNNAKQFDSLPATAKLDLIAKGRGIGLTAENLRKEIVNGRSIEEIAEARGYDPTNIPMDYAPTQSNITQFNNREFIGKETDYMNKYIKENTTEYARTLMDRSPKFVKDQLFGLNKDKQAKYLAARALSPELANLRVTFTGAKGTVAALNAMKEKSMMEMKIFRSLVSPEVYEKAQSEIDRVLQESFKRASAGKYTSSGASQTTKTYDGKKYVFINGSWHEEQ